MSPVRGCDVCGRPGCRKAHGRTRSKPERRAYSDTAEYRAMKELVIATYGTACQYCAGHAYTEDGGSDPLVLAHYPVSHADGGPFELENLRPAHRSCNARAGR